jgi:hypothetical protein
VNDEAVIVCATKLVGEAVVIKSELGVCLLGVLGDVGRLPEPCWERRNTDVLAEDPWSRGFR